MSAWYGFNHNPLPHEIMNPSNRIPDAVYDASIITQIKKGFQQPPVKSIQSCVDSPPCKTWVEWQPSYSECPPTWISWGDATNGLVDNVEIGQKDSRIWIGDLSPAHYNRGLVSGAQWWSESTKPHIRNRQMFAQYLQATLYPNSSPHEKRLDSIKDAYPMLLHKYGQNAIQYTSF